MKNSKHKKVKKNNTKKKKIIKKEVEVVMHILVEVKNAIL